MKFLSCSLPNHKILCAVFVIFFVVSFALLLAAWVTGWDLTKQNPNTTFSNMLATNSVVAGLYLGFWGVEVVQTIFVCFVLIKYYTEIKDIIAHDRSYIIQDVYFALTVMFVVLSVLKLVGFMGVYTFRCNVPSEELAHYVMASLGFGSCIMISLLLFIRRLVWWNHAISVKRADSILLGFDFVYVAGIIAAAIVFLVQMLGIPEMILAFTLQAEMLILIYDIWKDPESYQRKDYKSLKKEIKLHTVKQNNYLLNMARLHGLKNFV